MAEELTQANIAALSYHAGLGDSERSMVQQRWVQEDGCKVTVYIYSSDEVHSFSLWT